MIVWCGLCFIITGGDLVHFLGVYLFCYFWFNVLAVVGGFSVSRGLGFGFY